MRPVLYLDLDDTLVAWPEGRGGSPRGADGAGDFLRWALERCEVRWLTTWCPGGRMPSSLLSDLARLVEVPREALADIRGIDWSGSRCKLDGVAWLEHVVMRRPFLWVEDEYGFGERERRFLEAHGMTGRYRHVNVSADPGALARLHRELRDGGGWA
jgi:hypothetical protein